MSDDLTQRLEDYAYKSLLLGQFAGAATRAALGKFSEVFKLAKAEIVSLRKQLQEARADVEHTRIALVEQVEVVRATLTREREAAGARADAAEALNETLTRGTSPCGHWSAYAVTTDGGKHITCLQCRTDAAERALTAAHDGTARLREALKALADSIDPHAVTAGYPTPVGRARTLLATLAAPQCDHKFVDSTHCLKCGWAPPVASQAAPLENRGELTAVRLESGGHAIRLRDWARLLGEHGNDISRWGDRHFVAATMERIAKTLDELGRGFYYREPPVASPRCTCGATRYGDDIPHEPACQLAPPVASQAPPRHVTRVSRPHPTDEIAEKDFLTGELPQAPPQETER